MMGILNALSPRASSKTNSVTMLAFGVVFLVLGICGVWYWQYVETQTLHLKERNFRALAVTSHALGKMAVNYGTAFNAVIKGKPPCTKEPASPCQANAYKDAVEALPNLQDVTVVRVVEDTKSRDEFIVRFVNKNGISPIQLTYVSHDSTGTRWKIKAVINIGTIMKQLVTEDIFSNVLLADRNGRVLYQHQSTRDASGFEFEDVSSLLHRRNDSESKDSGQEKGRAARKEDLVPTLPLFNEAPIGGISHAIFAQAADLLADRGTAQTLILVGIVPAGQFHAEARAIPLNPLLLVAGLLLTLFFALPYVKLRTNEPTERLTPISVAVLVVSSFMGIVVLIFGLADLATYRNLEQHLDARLKVVSGEIRKQFNDDVKRGLDQLKMFDNSCLSKCSNVQKHHLAQHLCIRDEGGDFLFFQSESDKFFQSESGKCSYDKNKTSTTKVVYRDVETMFWVESTGEIKVLQSRDPAPWKYVNLKERQYVRRILKDETLIRKDGEDGIKFWIEPIFSRTTGENTAVFSKKSESSTGQPIVAALEVKLPSFTGVGVPPGMGFAVIDQEGEVLFHSDARRNLRENLFEETDRDDRLQQAVFARATDQFDGRYWGKDRHFHITPLFSTTISESPDVHWSLVAYWDTDMLRALNLRALYSSAVLFLIYGIIAMSIGITGWWIFSRAKKAANRWVWPQPEHLQRYRIAMGLLVVSLAAEGIWYLRPHPYPEMLLWGLLPVLAAVVVVLSIPQTETNPTDKNKTNVSVQQRYRLAYALVVTLILLTFVVIPTLVIFRVAIDVEWRLLAKFALYDLERDHNLQAQKVRLSYPSTLFVDSHNKGEVRAAFLKTFSNQNVVYANFPFESIWQEESDRVASSDHAVQRGDERLIRWLYHVIDRPRIGHRSGETDMFLEPSEQWRESEGGRLWREDRSQGTTPTISLSPISSPVPQWLYVLLAFGGLASLVALRVRKIYVLTAVICVLVCVLGGFLWLGLVREALAGLGVSAVLYGACYVLPTFAAKRVLLLDFPYPPMELSAVAQAQESAGMGEDFKQPAGWSVDSWDVLIKETSGLRNALRWTEIPWQDELIKSLEKQDLKDDFDVVKERIIREFQKKAADQYLEMWKQRTASEHQSLFNLARDGFLHARNPDIEPLLESRLIVADLNLRPMNESFRRFIIRTGLSERLDEDIAQAKTGMWFQVWRPIGVGLVLIMVFLVLTQEHYRQITLAFLGVLPALLGVLSQALTSSKKEKPESVASA